MGLLRRGKDAPREAPRRVTSPPPATARIDGGAPGRRPLSQAEADARLSQHLGLPPPDEPPRRRPQHPGLGGY